MVQAATKTPPKEKAANPPKEAGASQADGEAKLSPLERLKAENDRLKKELSDERDWRLRDKKTRHEIRNLLMRKEVLSEQVKEVKAQIEARTKTLVSDDDAPLFDQKPKGEDKKSGETSANHSAKKTPPADDDGWKNTTIAELSRFLDRDGKRLVSGSLVKKLEAAKLATLGQLFDYLKKGKWITDIDGIGKAAADKIDDAIEQLMAERAKASAPSAKHPDPGNANQSWRSAKLADLFEYGFVATDLQPLAEAHVATAGALWDFLNVSSPADVAGLAESRHQPIKDALKAYVMATAEKAAAAAAPKAAAEPEHGPKAIY